jgi:hypothetical protein
MEKVAMLVSGERREISEFTGFDGGERFPSEGEVRQYFTVENMRALGLGGSDEGSERGNHALTQDELDRMSETVIKNRWHCDF